MYEQRNSKRFKTVWKIYLKLSDGKYHLAGFLMDIGSGGARIFLDSLPNFKPQKKEIIKIMIKPKTDSEEPKGLSVEISWAKEWKGQNTTYEIGVRFLKESPEEQEYLNSLIKRFSAQKNNDENIIVAD